VTFWQRQKNTYLENPLLFFLASEEARGLFDVLRRQTAALHNMTVEPLAVCYPGLLKAR
jgi:hypothetical protein